MATLGFLLDPDLELPSESDCHWFGHCTGFMSGTWMAWQKLKSNLDQTDLPNQPWFDAPGLTTNAADYMDFMRPEHKQKYDAYVEQRYADWIKQGKPDVQIVGGPADFESWSGQPSKLSADNLSSYRGLKASKAKQGKLAFLHHDSDPFFCKLSPADSVELAMLAEMARCCRGTYLAIWTYGHTLQMVVDRFENRHWFSLRLSKPSDQSRPDTLTQLKQAFEDSRLKPDWTVIEQELASASISVTRWFLAFGIPGAMELAPAEATELWALMESEGKKLLKGDPTDPVRLKALNKYLVSKLPSKGGKGSARKLSAAASGLARLVGWAQVAPRQALAEQYWTIVDSPNLDQLTTGLSPKGSSASLGRLLSYYQGADLRDALFLALAAAEAEKANGHAFVGPLEVLAENCSVVGCVLAVFPQQLQSKFREHFGIGDGSQDFNRGWAAELFVDLPGLLKADMVKETLAFLKKNKCKGVALRVEPGTAAAHGDTDLFGNPDFGSIAGSLSGTELAKALGLSLFAAAPSPEINSQKSGLSRQAISQGLLGPDFSLILKLSTRDTSYQQQLNTDLAEFFPLRWFEDGTLYAGSQSRVNANLLKQLLCDSLPST